MSDSKIISHLFNKDNIWTIQTNEEHCKGVSLLAHEFASEFGMGDWGTLLGLLHDRGKESAPFQAYIKRSSGYDETAYSNGRKDHSYVGAILAHRLHDRDRLYWLSNVIAGHHRGLYDIDELESLLTSPIPEEVSQEIPTIGLPLPSIRLKLEDSSHITRMLFSCLVDADWLDTESFMSPDKASSRGKFDSIRQLNDRLENYRKQLDSLPSTPLNEIRNEIQKKCEAAAALSPGFFSLTVPTGGGKTLASIIWALNHAIKYNKKRVIIAIPFTSIIVQTASILKKIFGDNNVIEHHSAMNEEAANDKALLACENWDAPIIVTTNVQLFESMFSNRPSSCRKLHSIAGSVVILDEVQTLPLTYLQPIVDGMKTYEKIFGTSFLFCTASQPILDGNHRGSNEADFIGIDRREIRSVINPGKQLHRQLRRAAISICSTPYTYDTLANELREHDRVLCVVNSRRHALKVYEELSKDTSVTVFHLSRSMCASHILATINEIKTLLSDSRKPIRVVSTQLIEAGVDIDFPVVYRQLAGLDSILQSAGRCNREGRLEMGKTVVFSLANDESAGAIRLATDTMKDLVSLYPDADWLSPDMIHLYYEKLYHRTPYFDKEGIKDLLSHPLSCQFEEAAKKFRLINDEGINIIVNFGDAEKIIEKLINHGPSRKLSRQLGRYTVNIPLRVFKNFRKSGLIEEPFDGFYFVPFKEQYDSITGLHTDNELIEQTFII